MNKLTQYETHLLSAIQGFWCNHSRPPIIAEMVEQLGYSEGTVCNAAKRLRDKGLLHKRRGLHLPSSKLLRPTEAAELLNISRSSLNTWMARGYINRVQTPGGYSLIHEDEVERISELRKQPRFGNGICPPANWCNWLVGFTDGEGTFGITGHKRNGSAIPNDYTIKYQVFQRADRISVLTDIQDNLKCGSIYTRKARKTSGPGAYYIVQDLPSVLHIVVPLFEQYPPRIKYNEFRLWREAAILKRDGTKHIDRLHTIKEELRHLYAYHP